jgi:cell division protein FtsQ
VTRAGLSPLAAFNAAGAVIAGGLFVVLLTGGRLAEAGDRIAAGADAQAADLGFRVQAVHLQGASAYAEPHIRAAITVQPGDPILGLDLDAVRAAVEGSGWVKSATVVRLLPDTLVVTVQEKGHMAVWQHAGRTRVIDTHGQVIPEADAGSFPDLPLVVGAGAEETAGDILPLVRARPRLTARLEALVRVDRRRWDLRLKDGALIQLPAVAEDSALLRLDQLDQRSRVLELGFARIDLRDPEIIAVRPREATGADPSHGGA